MNSKKDDETNYFLTQLHFPEVQSIFDFQPKSLEAIKKDCLVVLDTNVLLLPYTIGSKSLGEIKDTYKQLIEDNKLAIPGQVVREFAKNRPNKLSEIYQQVSNYKSKINKIDTPKYPLLENQSAYCSAIEYQYKINELFAKYTKELDNILKYIKNLNWDDHVSLMYAELLKGEHVIELKYEQEELVKEFEERSKNNIPPGFRDKGKSDGGIGDFLIWKTILQLGNEKNCDLIFVSADEKNDWYHQSMNQPLYPRYELVQEYRRISKGATFRILNLSSLLELYGATKEAVHEIKSIEKERIAESNQEVKEGKMKFTEILNIFATERCRIIFCGNSKAEVKKFVEELRHVFLVNNQCDLDKKTLYFSKANNLVCGVDCTINENITSSDILDTTVQVSKFFDGIDDTSIGIQHLLI